METTRVGVQVLVTAHNSEKYLQESLNSILPAVANRPWVFIFHDDGSTDSTFDIAYAFSKTCGADAVIIKRSDKHKISFNIARCFSFVGPYLPLNLHYAIGNFIYNALNNDVITIKGTGNDVRSYLYIADAMIWLFKMLFSSKNNQIYNVGSSYKISIKDLAFKARDLIEIS